MDLALSGRRVLITFDGVNSFFYLWVNGQKVGEHAVRDGDKLEIGDAVFTYRAGGA